MKVGIFFGGQSREREISFAGGRTVYDNLNKSLFEPVPIFVDSTGHFILLKWEYLYKGTIRDFYPPASFLSKTSPFQIYVESLGELSEDQLTNLIGHVGRKITPDEFKNEFDFAFLALHGPYGEDGNIQGLLEWYNIPYSGSGILPSALGADKSVQKTFLEKFGFERALEDKLMRQEWLNTSHEGKKALLEKLIGNLGLPFVIKAPRQGSSIGVSILADDDVALFTEKVNKSFFMQSVDLNHWRTLNATEKNSFIQTLVDIREGIGVPLSVDNEIFTSPEVLLTYIEKVAIAGQKDILLQSLSAEESVLFESFIEGKEFSCIVIQREDGSLVALPPTEIIKNKDVFDYRAKYLAGISRKITPIDISEDALDKIRKACCRLFDLLHCDVYARIDGFITKDGQVFLNDPNTTSGMLPSSFFFHQAAEIGLNPSQFLTYIIRNSLAARAKAGKFNYLLGKMLTELDQNITLLQEKQAQKIKVGVIMGGFSSERHISVESGRNIYEKLSSSGKYQPVPLFLTGDEAEYSLYLMPINIMLKDNADDIKEKIESYQSRHPLLEKIKTECLAVSQKYADQENLMCKLVSYDSLKEMVDFVFIALHGRPGEDGAIQAELEKHHIPYNGSNVASSRITINKFETNEILAKHGIKVAKHIILTEAMWTSRELYTIGEQFPYPFIAKPIDDGCSAAVKKINSAEELAAYAKLMFRETKALLPEEAKVLNLRPNEEFPQKGALLIEEIISKGDAAHFLEITGGLLTRTDEAGEVIYEVFEPSEVLAQGAVLSLEEKFLAGEGQNITPARFHENPEERQKISALVKQELEKVARILNVEGYARIDAFVKIYTNKPIETFIIEVNSLPGMTPATCIFHQSAINGYTPYGFIDAIIHYGTQRIRKIRKDSLAV